MPDAAQKRLIVPDTPALVPAYFAERFVVDGKPFPLRQRSERLLNAILVGEVITFAPQILRFEFLSTASQYKTGYRGKVSIGEHEFREIMEDFLFDLPITYVPGRELDFVALDLINNQFLSPPDAYHLACAMSRNAELWVSHEHSDGFVENARRVHNKVYTLVSDNFNLRR